MPNHWLRDMFLMVAVVKEREREFFGHYSLIQVLQRSQDLVDTFKQYIETTFPWREGELQGMREDLAEAYERIFGKKPER